MTTTRQSIYYDLHCTWEANTVQRNRHEAAATDYRLDVPEEIQPQVQTT